MKKTTLLIAAMAFMALTAGARAEEGRAVVCGTLLKYKSDLWKELPSAPREYLVIRFDKPFEVEHSNWENENGKDGKVRIIEIQVDYDGEKSDLQLLIGKKVIAEGEIAERDLTRQLTPLIFFVEPGNIKAGAFMVVKPDTATTHAEITE